MSAWSSPRSPSPVAGNRPGRAPRPRPAARPPRPAIGPVAVYAAVVRQLVTKDHTFEDEETPFERVFIDVHVDATGDPNAPGAHTRMGTRLSAEEQAAILRELVDLPRVEFVEDPDSVVVNEGDCAQVIKGNGALVTLGPISGDAERVTVPNDMSPGAWAACGSRTCSSARRAAGASRAPKGRSSSRSAARRRAS